MMPDLTRKQVVHTSRTGHANMKATDGYGVKAQIEVLVTLSKRKVRAASHTPKSRKKAGRKAREGSDVGK